MDRSFLSHPEVVAASRAFVCARLLTYESAEEAEVLQRVFRGRDGLENSVFAILDPSGERKLTRSGRSPGWAFEDAPAMARAMQRIAKRHPGRKGRAVGLPLLVDVRRALNTARADDQLLVIVCGEGERRTRLESELARLAWSVELIGKFLYVRADAKTEWKNITGSQRRPQHGLVVVEPGEFGTDGRVLATLEKKPTQRALLAARKKYEPRAVDTRRLRRRGRRAGLYWETAIPVTDRGGRRR